MKIYVNLGLILAAGITYASTSWAQPPKTASAKKVASPHQYTPEEISRMSYDVDLRDVAKILQVPEAKVILDSMIQTPENYFPQSVKVAPDGVHRAAKTRVNSVFGIEIEHSPQIIPGGEEFKLNAFFNVGTPVNGENYFFRKLTVQVGGTPLQVLKVNVDAEIPASETHFWVRVGLTQTKLVLEDSEHHIQKVFPLGVGGFDEGAPTITDSGKVVMPDAPVKFLTDTVINGKIARKNAMAARNDPKYYQNMPFLFITGRNGQWYGLGFHIHPFPGEALKRGFQSHGCMRMREKDLYELYSILMYGGNSVMPVLILPSVAVNEDTPYPITGGWHSILYVPPDETNPKYHTVIDKMEQKDKDPSVTDGDDTKKKDETELKQTIVKRGPPPVDRLSNLKVINVTINELIPYIDDGHGGKLADNTRRKSKIK